MQEERIFFVSEAERIGMIFYGFKYHMLKISQLINEIESISYMMKFLVMQGKNRMKWKGR